MLEIQKYLRSFPLEKLTEEFGVIVTPHETLPLVILNYSMITSPKYHPLVKQCRGLTLELDTWRLVCKSFDRFYNIGEDIEGQKNFCWSDCITTSKEDGSLGKLYWYGDQWYLNTRGSYGDGVINGSEFTWQSLFYPLVSVNLHNANKNYSYILELCSYYNKIVRHYSQPTVFLLTVFDNRDGQELPFFQVQEESRRLSLPCPTVYNFSNQGEVTTWLEAHPEPTFEGVVLMDCNGMRIKAKKSSYVNLHHLKNNNNIFLPQYLVPLILSGEVDEALIYFPELQEHVSRAKAKLDAAYLEAKAVYDAARLLTCKSQRGIMVCKATKLTAPVFTALNSGRNFERVWAESQNVLIKILFE